LTNGLNFAIVLSIFTVAEVFPQLLHVLAEHGNIVVKKLELVFLYHVLGISDGIKYPEMMKKLADICVFAMTFDNLKVD